MAGEEEASSPKPENLSLIPNGGKRETQLPLVVH